MQGRLYAQQRRVLLGSLRPGERLASGPRGRGCALVPQPHPLPTWRGAPRPLGGGGDQDRPCRSHAVPATVDFQGR